MLNFFDNLPTRYSALLAVVAGVLYPLSFAPYGWYVLGPVSITVLLMSWSGRTTKQAAGNGFLFGFAAFLTGMYWVTISMHTFGGVPLPLAIALMLALVIYMAVYFAVLGYFTRRFMRQQNTLLWLVGFSGLWMSIEWLRGWVLTGLGWLSPGYAQVDGPLLGFLPVIGVLGVGWIVALSASALSNWILVPTMRNRIIAIFTLFLWPMGHALTFVNWTEPDGSSIRVSLVQGAVPQEKKWLPDELQPTIDLYLALTRQSLDSDLVVWPEAAIPRYKQSLEPLWAELSRISETTQTDFLVGTIDYDSDTDQRFNSVSAFGSAQDVYQKRHLVPFGEYFPVPGFVKRQMQLMNLPYQNFTAGPDGQPPILVAGQKVSVSICYEDVFGHEMLDSIESASLMVNVTNDAWFGGSLAPHQHLQIAQVRAAEVGRYLLRSTNNGISAVIDRHGHIVKQSPQFEPAVLTAAAHGTRGVTPYTRWGDWPIVLWSLLSAAFVVVYQRRQVVR